MASPKRSTGRGISPAYCDETGHWQIYYSIFKKDRKEFSKKIGEKIERAQDTIKHVCKADESDWYNFFKILTEAEIKANSDSIKDGCFEKVNSCLKLLAHQTILIKYRIDRRSVLESWP